MNKLIKLEIYRFTHLKKFFCYAILAFVLLIPMAILGTIADLESSLSEVIPTSEALILMSLMMLPPVMAIITGQLYNKGKIGFYEVMAGEKISHIILSKLFVEGIFFAIMAFVCGTAFYLYIGFANGFGGITHIEIRLLLIFVEILHVTCVSVLMVTCFMSMGVAGMLGYVRFILIDSALFPALTWLFEEVLDYPKIAGFFEHMSSYNRFSYIAARDLDLTLVLHTCIGFVVECVLWYILAYTRMKNKCYR